MARLVKFCHPGAQWRSAAAEGIAPWATGADGHFRRYIEVLGRYLRNGQPEAGHMGFWGEYEAPTRFRRLARRPSDGFPAFVHTPVEPPGEAPPKALNTDPLVVGGPWLYSNCRQRSLGSLRRLERGDVVVFGSLVQRSFVIDTIFVVAEAIPYAGGMARQTLGARLPPSAFTLALDLVRRGDYTLYVGATYEAPVNGLFSFVPAVAAAEHALGFPRPKAPPALQGLQAMGVQYLTDPGAHWQAVADHVAAQGLCLGIGTGEAAR